MYFVVIKPLVKRDMIISRCDETAIYMYSVSVGSLNIRKTFAEISTCVRTREM